MSGGVWIDGLMHQFGRERLEQDSHGAERNALRVALAFIKSDTRSAKGIAAINLNEKDIVQGLAYPGARDQT